jgi:hypothetical protein
VTPAALGEVAHALSRHAVVAFAAVVMGRASVFAMVPCRDTDALYDHLSVELARCRASAGSRPPLLRHRAKRAATLLLPPSSSMTATPAMTARRPGGRGRRRP